MARRRSGEKEGHAETAYAVTGPRAEQAAANKIAARARAHRVPENTVHRTKGVTFSEGVSQSTSPPARPGRRERLARSGPRHPSPGRWVGIAGGRGADARSEAVSALRGFR